MKEFIEKLIGRLEDHKKYCEMCHEEFPNAKMSLTYEVQINAYKNAIEIVNQLAEEYKGCTLCYLGSPCEYQNADARIKDNNGWIPCSEKTPLATGYYLVTIKGYNRAMYAWWINTERKWQYLNSQKEITEVIAWQPLPAPYEPKGE